MAGARAAASISTTIGVAFATLLVMGGILAGPAILDCSADKHGFGACLRDRIANSGLIPPEAERIDKPVLVSEVPVSEIPGVAAEPPRLAGWIEANANEFAGMPSVSVTLTAPGGSVGAEGLLVGQGNASGKAILAAPTGKILADGEVAVNALSEIEIALAAPMGALSAMGAGNEPVSPAELTLLPKGGVLRAGGGEGTAPALEANAAPVRGIGDLTITGSIGADPVPGGTALTAPEPLPFEEPLIKAEAEMPPLPVTDPRPVIRFDPQFPNVLVLPPPASGEDSSFRTLQLN